MKTGMSSKTFQAPVSDEYDDYPNAYCKIHSGSVNQTTTFDSESRDSDVYSHVESFISGASYKIMFWNTPEARAKGKLPRPLFHVVDGVLTDVFVVDMDHADAININNGELDSEEKGLQLMRHDLPRQS